jgi:hypothetical protein
MGRMKKILAVISLCLAVSAMSGCVFAPLVPIAGTAYGGYEIWKGSKVIKYYAADSDTVYLAIQQSCKEMKLETRIPDPVSPKEYSLEILGNHPAMIQVLRTEKNVSKVVIEIGVRGDKQYAEFFFKTIDDHIARIARNDLKQQSP